MNEQENKENVPASEELIDMVDMEEEELPPPEEENEALEVNVGNIIGIGMIAIVAIILIVFIAVNFNKKDKKKTVSDELDKAGTKTEVDFKFPDNSKKEVIEEPEITIDKSDDEIEEALNSLPEELQLPKQADPGVAPVTSVGSTSTIKSDRPDTRNSRSPRKIEGLAALNYSSQVSNINSVSNALNGRMTKEEYIAQQMAQTQSLQNQLFGNGSSGGTGVNVDDSKSSFFSNGSGSVGNGQYLSDSCLWDGTIISGALVTAINTDNPGVVIARVTENVYSSYDHRYLLIPEGTLLFATYNSSISYGQNKVQVAWNLLIRPDKYRITLGNMNGVSAQGASGYKGNVTNHPFETLKALGLVALYSILQTEITGDIEAEKNEYLKNTMTDVYSEASKIGNKIVDRALDIKPTLKIKEGTEIKLITNVPLELPPVEVNPVTQKYVRQK